MAVAESGQKRSRTRWPHCLHATSESPGCPLPTAVCAAPLPILAPSLTPILIEPALLIFPCHKSSVNVLDSAALQVTTSVVHGNHVHHTSVAIDVDGTSGPHVSVYNNVLQHSTGYGLWFGAPSSAAVSFQCYWYQCFCNCFHHCCFFLSAAYALISSACRGRLSRCLCI